MKHKIKNNFEYISLNKIASKKGKEKERIISSWIQKRETVEFLAVFEALNNPDFNQIEYELILDEIDRNVSTLTPKEWVRRVNGSAFIYSEEKKDNYAEPSVAFSFALDLFPEYKALIIERYKSSFKQNSDQFEKEIFSLAYKNKPNENAGEFFPPFLSKSEEQEEITDKTELYNKAVFGLTEKEWEKDNKKGSLRDSASSTQLLVLKKVEEMDEELNSIGDGEERIKKLREYADFCFSSLRTVDAISAL